ncbi:lactosylceramide 1,3-N-acetyl-beta-D-glucosaminyltransferase-like [Oppia nitens]|uniref:lactosylceramide 1,3-N-acetyl-beta-D-glucosaminyltransferase-like n=1 Tax=Oppia nitens TaxID=1686743 RepID=UPI0023DB78F6|nr:lactosylceramide 1,3-N-acetyl-beta-D-glucosaminyltransferase-like [Oppia nitens]
MVCRGGHNITIFIMSGNGNGYYQRRQQLRKGWVGAVRQNMIDVWFVLGLSSHSNDNNNNKELLTGEADSYHDLIQFGFLDDYLNLTLKTIATLGWHRRYCPDSRLLFKLDDDVFVNADKLLDVLPELMAGLSATGEPGIGGQLNYVLDVVRDNTSKWYVPQEYYQPAEYPSYPTGSAYFMDNLSRDRLLDSVFDQSSSDSRYIQLPEDAFMCGIVANRTGVRRFDSPLIVVGDYCKCLAKLHTVPIHFACNPWETWLKFINSPIISANLSYVDCD